MGEQRFTIGGAFEEGWRLTKENLGFLIGYQIILYVLSFIFGISYEGRGLTLWYLFGWALIVLVKMGLYKSSVLIVDSIKPTFEQLYKNWRLFISWVVAGFLFGIMFAIGLILLIVPGCYILARYGFFPFFIIDKEAGPIEALKLSAKATEGIRWPIFLLFLACLGLDILGFLLLGVGLLITIPITLLALAKVYRQITATNLS